MRKFATAALLISLCPAWAAGGSNNLASFTNANVDISDDITTTVGINSGLYYTKTGGALGRWGVGNGGDTLRITFARARDYAANVVLRINPNSLSRIKGTEAYTFILDNQKFLAADILQSEHNWVPEAIANCAMTQANIISGQVPPAAPINFSYPTCRESNRAGSFLKIAELLIHEATHHFRGGDETFADQIAIAVIDAWQSGLMDSTPIGLTNAPVSSQKHSAVWTGTSMIVIGGFNDETVSPLATATSYDPLAATWSNLYPPAWFTPRYDALSIWTGTEVLVWGGFNTTGSTTDWIYDGALYCPATKVWTQLSKPIGWKPKASTWKEDPRQSLVWTGEKALIWGGVDSSNSKSLGAIFDPKTRAWETMNNTSTAAPLRIAGHSAVWTGKTMIVWGGYKGSSDSSRTITDEGAIYDPATDSWVRTAYGSAAGTPSNRAGHQAVWIGNKMVVMSGGGVSSVTDISATGGIYDPATDTWTSFQSELMAERVGHKMIWNGEEILLIGGRSNRLKTLFGEVYAFSPATLRWRILPGAVIPPRRVYSSIVWTGSSALVWSGYAGDSKTQKSGALYYP